MELKIDEIKIGHRSRKKFTEIDKLADSIDQLGPLHPIIVNSENTLIVGERRVRENPE